MVNLQSMRSEFLLLLLPLAAGASVVGFRWYRRRTAGLVYRRMLENALADGILTPAEEAELARYRHDREVSPAEERAVALAVYRGALRSAAADARLTDDEDRHLVRLQSALGLTEEDLGGDREMLGRLRLLARVEAGHLPKVNPPMPLVQHETCHWVVPASLADLLELPGRAGAGAAAGVALSLRRPARLPVAAQLDPLRTNEEVLPVDLGLLMITSRRVVFRGAKRTVSLPHARLKTLVLHADGFRLDEPANKARAVLLVEDPELTAAVLLGAAQRRHAEIRPTRRDRTA